MSSTDMKPSWSDKMISKIFIANDKGGVGKSTIAQMCVQYLDQGGTDTRIVEYDRQPKLKRFYPPDRVISHSIAPDWETQLRQPEKLAAQWDPMARWLRVVRPLVVDLGAQVWDYFAAWAADASLSELVDTSSIAILIPVTADVEAVAGARRIIAVAPSVLPKARVVLLSCDKDGEVELLKGVPEFKELIDAAKASDARFARIPVMLREAYPALAAAGLRFDQITASTPHELVARSGLAPTVAARTIKAVRTWSDETLSVLQSTLAEPASAPHPVPRKRVVKTVRIQPSRKVAEAGPRPVPADMLGVPQSPMVATSTSASPVTVASAASITEDRALQPKQPPAAAPSTIAQNFDEQAYLALYPDVRAAIRAGEFTSGYDHYLVHGRSEGRRSMFR